MKATIPQQQIFIISKDTELASFKTQSLIWADTHFNNLSFFNNNGIRNTFSSFENILFAGCLKKFEPQAKNNFEALKAFIQNNPNTYISGYFSYDLKNEIESLQSNNTDPIQAQEISWIVPEVIIKFKENQVEVIAENPEQVFKAIQQTLVPNPELQGDFSIHQNITKEKYLEKVNDIKRHLLEGDIYELNFCIEFSAQQVKLNPVDTYLQLIELSPMPFSVYQKTDHIHLICASPERFLKKEGNKLISQPIKGTAKRAENPLEDQKIKESLISSEKEKAENMMIVDLVRNDLSISCQGGSVKVDELFTLYSFKQVHQMISTVSGQLRPEVHPLDAIKNAFPMGSMTGAPKVKAMELIEKFEESKRGLFSGAVGYFNPNGDFDLNVVIRSILYNSKTSTLSFSAGSAITYDCDPEAEYNECLLKAQSMKKVLGA
jgi:para-aminobenzoate synthetase component I